MKRLYLYAALTLGIWPAASQVHSDRNGKYTVLGLGNASCGEWTKDRAAKGWEALVDEAWIQGFLTSYNLYGPSTINISRETDRSGVSAWIDNYWAQHPLDAIATAGEAVVIELLRQGNR
jgi:hypothetical protein